MYTAASKNSGSPRDQGFAIFTVIFIMVIFAILGIGAVALITGSTQMMTDENFSQQAFDVADAGLDFTAEQLENDTDWLDNVGTTRAIGPGSFTTTFLAATATTATVQSVGTVQGISRRIQQDFAAGGTAAFNYGIYTEQEIDVGGSSSGDVYGPVSAGGDVDESSGVNFHDAIEENNPDADVPTPIWSYWQSIADHVISGNYNFGAGTYTGIYYITGNVVLNSNATLNGTIITRGNVTANAASNISIVASPPNPAIFAEGYIKFNGSANLNIQGWVLSLSYISFLGNSDVTSTGGFTAAGDVVFSGNTDVDMTYDGDLAPSSDGVTGGQRSGFVFTNWQETY